MARLVGWLFLLASLGFLVWALMLDGPEPKEPHSTPRPVASHTSRPEPTATPTTDPTTSTGAPTSAEEDLADLATIDRHPKGLPDYNRALFGEPWADTDGNHCNQRDDVLARDAVAGTVKVGRQGACDHDVLAGTWVDPYTDRRIVLADAKDPEQAQRVQIDHVVPLSEAWVSGASSWSEDRRKRFATDLGNLLAVDGPTNASKGDSDPAAWRPRKQFQCAYGVRWVAVKHRWRLAADPSEVRAVKELLAYCR